MGNQLDADGVKSYFGLRGMKLQVAIGAIAGLDFLLFGYDQGVMGGLLTLQSFLKYFPQVDTRGSSGSSHASVINGITVASYTLGCFFGAVATIFIGDILGRRRMIFTGSCIMIVGAALQCSAFSLVQLIIARVITGFGNGMNTSTVPTWQSETSKSHRRGQLVMIEGALITGGVCLSYWLDFGMSFTQPSTVSWRFPIAFQIFFALIIVACVLFLPESPRWLVLKGKEDEALRVLSALNDLPPDDKHIYDEFQAIKDTVIEMQSGGFRDLFVQNDQKNFQRSVLAWVNQCFQQISGINLITYYIPTVLELDIGLSPFLSRIIAAANGTEYFLASWIAVFIIEKVGRRKLMIFGAAGQSFSMIILSIMAAHPSSKTGIVATLFLFLFNTFFAIGWLGMTWLYPAEIVPLRIRASANALSTSSNWIFNFMVVMITPVAFANIGYKTYVIFAVINGALILPVVYFFYPETAYRSLEEMDAIFQKSTGWRDAVKVAREEPHRYGKHGEILIAYDESEAREVMERRRSSVTGMPRRKSSIGATAEHIEKSNVDV